MEFKIKAGILFATFSCQPKAWLTNITIFLRVKCIKYILNSLLLLLLLTDNFLLQSHGNMNYKVQFEYKGAERVRKILHIMI